MNNVLSNLRKILAIEILEYEDKNYLSGDNKSRNEEKILLIEDCIRIIKHEENINKLNEMTDKVIKENDKKYKTIDH